jgi:tRNA-Thr(GGU) m(6)t(6)A37 methyltransferase TsaA
MLEPVAVKSIGVVRNSVKEPQTEGWESVESRIIVQDRWAGALDGLEGFSHIFVIYWMHRVSEELRRTTTHVHPRGDPQIPLQGVFATRSPLRPNPIGLSVVPIVGRRGNVLRVRGLDAINGTPVLDLKPYVAPSDSVPQATIPAWLQRHGISAQERPNNKPREL